MDNHFVPNLTLGLPVVEALLAVSADPARLPPDDRRPRPLGPGATPRPARQSVTFHVEAATRPAGPRPRAARRGARAGMALKPGTPCAPYEDLLPELDMVLVMTVEPGFGGQSFMDDQMPKVRAVREAVRRHGGDSGSRSTGASPPRRSSGAPRRAPTSSSPARRSTAPTTPAPRSTSCASWPPAPRTPEPPRPVVRVAVSRGPGVPPGCRSWHPDGHALRGRCNSEPAVTVRDPTAASGRLTRWNSGTDGESPDGRRRVGPTPLGPAGDRAGPRGDRPYGDLAEPTPRPPPGADPTVEHEGGEQGDDAAARSAEHAARSGRAVPARGARARRPRSRPRPQPAGRLRAARRRRRRRRSRLPRRRRDAARRGRGPGRRAGEARPCAARRPYVTLEPCAHTGPHRPVRAGAARGRGGPGRARASPTRTPSPRAAPLCCARPASRSTSGLLADEAEALNAGVDPGSPARAPVVTWKVAATPRRRGPPPPTAPAAG